MIFTFTLGKNSFQLTPGQMDRRMTTTRRDGQQVAVAESDDILVIDRSSPPEKWRYTCPNGHTDWDRTNQHIWCRTCRQQYESGESTDPEHWSIIDQKTGREIDWENVRVIE